MSPLFIANKNPSLLSGACPEFVEGFLFFSAEKMLT